VTWFVRLDMNYIHDWQGDQMSLWKIAQNVAQSIFYLN
jgi:hypothetical protein